MIVETTTRVILDTVEEAEIVAKYRADKGWKPLKTKPSISMFESAPTSFVSLPYYVESTPPEPLEDTKKKKIKKS